MRSIFDSLTLIIGTLSFVGASVLIITPLLTRHWTRRWVRKRLGATSNKATAATSPKTLPTQPAITDFLDAVARDVRSGFSLTAS